MEEYLKRYLYTAQGADGDADERKKGEPAPTARTGGGLLIVDDDPVWQKPVQMEEDSPDASGEEGSQVDEDIEVKRRTRRRRDTPSPEPGGAVREDLSPPRRRTRRDAPSPDKASRRNTHVDTDKPKDLSPPRRRTCHGTDEPQDISPPQRRNAGQSSADGDLSSPRKDQKVASSDLLALHKEVRRAGLITAEEFKEEMRKIKENERLWLASLDPTLIGKGAKPVFRDRKGRRISLEDLQKAAEEEKPKERKTGWDKGLVQKREAKARAQELEAEKNKSFARSRDDPELETMLRNRSRWGDPMAHLVKQKDQQRI